MNGSIRERADKQGRPFYEVVLEFRDPATNNRVQRTKSFKLKREAKRYLAEHQVDQERGLAVEPSKLTMGELLTNWLETYAAHKGGDKTFENYEGIIRSHLKPALGAIPVQKLTAKHLDTFYAEKRRAGCSEWALTKCHQRIRQVLSYALRQDVVARNVAEAATAPHEERKEMRTWSREQVLRFLAVAHQSTYGPIWLLALSTGMRRGELLGLRWRDLNFDGTALQVRQSLVALKRGARMKDPKSKSSRRPVGIPLEVVEAFREHRRDLDEQRRKLGALWQEHDLVFASEVGTPISPRNLPRDYDRLVQRADLPRIRIHDLRHTYTTLVLENGANLLAVSKQLGHAKPSTTTDVYGHVSERMQQQVTDTIRAALSGPTPTVVSEIAGSR